MWLGSSDGRVLAQYAKGHGSTLSTVLQSHTVNLLKKKKALESTSSVYVYVAEIMKKYFTFALQGQQERETAENLRKSGEGKLEENKTQINFINDTHVLMINHWLEAKKKAEDIVHC